MKDGKPYFAEMQRRSLMSDRFKIALAAKAQPVSFTAFDILYRDRQQLTDLPLMDRKRILGEVMIQETARFAISRFIDTQGIALYKLTEEQGLEGIVSKRKDSQYRMDIRMKDWRKTSSSNAVIKPPSTVFITPTHVCFPSAARDQFRFVLSPLRHPRSSVSARCGDTRSEQRRRSA